MRRNRSAAGLLAGLTVAVGAALAGGIIPAQAAGPPQHLAAGEVLAPTTTSNGTRTLVVDATTDLPVSNAVIAVQGKGFDVSSGLYVAVCADGSGAPEKLTKCVGGAIPDANTTTGWAHITADGTGPGGVKAAWGPDGSFSVTLALPSVDQGDVNCVTGKCSLYTASDDASVRTEDNAVPLTFAAAPPTSASPTPPTSSSPTAPTSPTAPKTATVQDIATPDIEAGKTQLVIFSGFAAGEQVNLTLFSAPITLSPVSADGTGVAQARFVVPADITAGTHRLEAIGQQSGTVGVASFRVTAPPPPTSASSTPSTSASQSATASSSAPASSSSSSSAAPSSSSAAPTTAVTPTNTDSGTSLWWLWLIIGIVVLAAIITAIVVYRRKKEQEQRERDEQAITDAAAREQATSQYDAPTVFLPPVRPGGPPPGEDPYGLLSGRDHPDNPTLYSGQDPAGPTEVIGPPDYDQGRGPYGQPLGRPGGGQTSSGQPGGEQPGGEQTGGEQTGGGPELPTEMFRPSSGPAGGPDGADGPHTAAWTPDEDDSDPPEPRGPAGG